MKTQPRPLPTVKNYRPTFAAFTAHCIAQREAREDEQHFTGPSHGPALGEPLSQARQGAPGFSPATCVAVVKDEFCGDYVCGKPAPFLDFVRGGFVCAAHKPERGKS